MRAPTLRPRTARSDRSLLNSRILPTYAAMPLVAIHKSDVPTWLARMLQDGT